VKLDSVVSLPNRLISAVGDKKKWRQLCSAKVNSAFHPSGVGKWVPAAAGKAKQVWLIPIANERVGVQVRLWNPLRTRAIPERFCAGDSLRRGAISLFIYLLPLPLPLPNKQCIEWTRRGRRRRGWPKFYTLREWVWTIILQLEQDGDGSTKNGECGGSKHVKPRVALKQADRGTGFKIIIIIFQRLHFLN